jgi:hypothetical protein
MPLDIPEGEAFRLEWTALPRRDRVRVRRLVRLGQPVDRRDAAVAVAYARFQRTRIWARMFWLWFVPGMVLALGAAAQVHPVMVGVVLATAAQALLAHRNLSRVERVNAAILDS